MVAQTLQGRDNYQSVPFTDKTEKLGDTSNDTTNKKWG